MRGDACILVFGVSGVGKTSACEDYARRHPQWVHLRASELLGDATAKDPQSLRVEPASDIEDNQALLGHALQLRRTAFPGRPFLIDAHGVIDNDRTLVRVPLAAVRAMNPDALILLEAPASVVVARRALDLRTRPMRTVVKIEAELRAEAFAVRGFAESLDLPVETASVIAGFDLAPLIAALRSTGPAPAP